MIAGRRVSVRTGQVIDRTEVEGKPTERRERESIPDWEDRGFHGGLGLELGLEGLIKFSEVDRSK